jgi:hypothetical protein
MNVVNPNNTTHEIVIIPRFYPTDNVNLFLYNETTQLQIDLNVVNSYTIVDGKMFVEFDYTFTEGQSFQVTITEFDDVVYRGKIFATNQEPQDYKLTDNVYYS